MFKDAEINGASSKYVQSFAVLILNRDVKHFYIHFAVHNDDCCYINNNVKIDLIVLEKEGVSWAVIRILF